MQRWGYLVKDMDVNEKDWKLFRKNLPDWQESYMEKLIKEYIEFLKGDGLASDKFWELEKKIKAGNKVRYKKYFYALRPLMASMYIEEKHMVPPVLFDDLLKMDIPAELRVAIDELLEIKKRTTEKEENPQLPVIKAFIESEIEKQKEIADSLPDDHNKDWSALDRLFLEMLGD